jgi:hypothetical protein
MSAAGLGLFGLILSGQIEAHDFVVTHRVTGVNVPQSTCFYTQNQQTLYANCGSSVYVSDKDSADVYVCVSSLIFVVRGAPLSLSGNPLISADCMKQVLSIPGPRFTEEAILGSCRDRTLAYITGSVDRELLLRNDILPPKIESWEPS